MEKFINLCKNIVYGDIMVVVGFNFTKINVERKSNVKGKIKISNNVTMKDVSQQELSLGKAKENGLKFTFEFTSKYDPDIGEISLTGEVISIEEEKKAKEILKEWKKSKKVPQDIMTNILNHVLTKCNIKALILSQDMNLPPPIPLPSVQPKQG